MDWLKKLSTYQAFLGTLFELGRIKLTKFESASFEDFTWRTLFSKTFRHQTFSSCQWSKSPDLFHSVAHHAHVGLQSLNIFEYARAILTWIPVDSTSLLDRRRFQATVDERIRNLSSATMTRLPVFMPHTIPENHFIRRPTFMR